MPSLKSILKESGDFLLIFGVGGLVLLMVLPLPPFLMDIFLVFSISLSVLILLVTLYSVRPLEFSVFPTILLFATLVRLTLNIASTRLILLNGSTGESAAGQVIQAFGYFVAGGNYVVGFIVFVILVIINFLVITKGAGRIAEVAARFTLDAMPGKQLAIDADLNAGIITDVQALERREGLEQEADFYGAMDGASKFVKGDAIAGILITLINIVGGFVIGMAQEGMSMLEASKIYTILTIGDGLVSQIPALIISLAAGIIVTKVSKKSKLADEIRDQTLGKWRPLGLAAVILFGFGLVPGLPQLPFMTLAILMGGGSFIVWRQQKLAESQAASGIEPTEESVEEQDDRVPTLDMIEVEVGYDLVTIVDQKSGGEFPSRIVGIRRQLATDMGIILPPVHVRDNLKLRPTEYKIYLKAAVIGQGELVLHHSLALDPGNTTRTIEGISTTDPTFGLDALWITDDQKESAVIAGYTVVDLPSVLATHLIEVIRHNLHEIFCRQDLVRLLDQLKSFYPKVITDLTPDLLPLGTILKVVQNLLKEQVSIRDLLTILEKLAENAHVTKDPSELTELVRVALGRNIAQQHMSQDENLYAITLSREIEEGLLQSVVPGSSGSQLTVDPDLARTIVEEIGKTTKQHLDNNQPPVVLTSQQIRPHLFRLIERFIPNLAVLAHSEVAGHVPVRPIGMIGELT